MVETISLPCPLLGGEEIPVPGRYRDTISPFKKTDGFLTDDFRPSISLCKQKDAYKL